MVQKKPKENILIDYTAWIFKWIFKIFLFLVGLILLIGGGNLLYKEYDKSQILKAEAKKEKARACLAKEIPILEEGIKSFRDSINPNSSLKDVVDVVFYEDTVISKYGLTGFRLKQLEGEDDKTDKQKKLLMRKYTELENSRYEDFIKVSDNNIKLHIAIFTVKADCDSDFNFLIKITDNEDRSLDTFNVWANNAPKGYVGGRKIDFLRDFTLERELRVINEKERKEKIIREKKRKERERIDAPKRIKREHEAMQEKRKQEQLSDPMRLCENQQFFVDVNGDKYCRHKDTGQEMFINFEKNRLEPSTRFKKTIPSIPKEKGGYDPNKGTSDTGISDKGPVHEF